MNTYWYPDDKVPAIPRSITIGNFDGVHKGHQYLLTDLTRQAQKETRMSTVVTFTPHPQEIIKRQTYPVLTPLEEQYQLFKNLGVDEVWVIPFTYTIQRLSPWNFYTDVICSMDTPHHILIGSDHRFGYKGRGTTETIQAIGNTHNIEVDVLDQYSEQQETVKTTYIKQLLQEGDVEQASQYLGRTYTLQGTVRRGKGFGAQLGFPTANVALNERKFLPKEGVYVVRIYQEGFTQPYYGVLNVGYNPVVEERTTPVAEVHILDFDEDIRETVLFLELLTYLREEYSEGSIEDLKQWIANDIHQAKIFLEAHTF